MSELSDLGKVLHEEHFRMLVLICGLESRITGEGATRPMNPRDAEDRALLEELLPALGQVIEHNAFEEQVLFPLLRKNGADDLATLLTQEHVTIGPLARQLRSAAAAVLLHGPGGDRWAEFRAAAGSLINEILPHLQLEELMIVQRLQLFLDPDTDHRLARALSLPQPLGSSFSDAPAGVPLEPRRFNPAVAAARSVARRRSTAPRAQSRAH